MTALLGAQGGFALGGGCEVKSAGKAGQMLAGFLGCPASCNQERIKAGVVDLTCTLPDTQTHILTF